MANFGGLGPEGALAEEKIDLRSSEMPQKSVLLELGFYNEGQDGRIPEKEASDSAFSRACPAPDSLGVQRMSESVFVEHAAQRWGMNPEVARAAFWASDVDGSGFLNRDEYLLLRTAFVAYHPQRDGNSPALTELRLRAVFARYSKSPVGMDRQGQYCLIRDLCAGAGHVRAIQEKMGLLNEESNDVLDMKGFKGLLGTLQAQNLRTRDLLHILDEAQKSRLVWDPSLITAPGAARSPQNVQSNIVGPAAVNEGLVLESALRAPAGSDWRGAMAAPRGSGFYFF